MSSLNGLSLDWNTPFGSSIISPLSQGIPSAGLPRAGSDGSRDRSYSHGSGHSSGHSPSTSPGRAPGGSSGGGGGGGNGGAIGQSWPQQSDTFNPWGDSVSSAQGEPAMPFGHSGGGGGGGGHAPPGLGPRVDAHVNVGIGMAGSFSSSIADAPNPPTSVSGSFDASARDPLWNTVEKLRADLTACQLELNKCRAENANLRQQLGYQ